MKDFTMLLTGCALGAVAMYMLDPDNGKKRRSNIRTKATEYHDDAMEAIQGKTKQIRSKIDRALDAGEQALQDATS